MFRGTTVEATVSRVVDGDTIRVFIADSSDDESLRILALDTEETNAGSSKPITPWGQKAKERAESFFAEGDLVTLEFPGTEDLEVCLPKYRGNFGRLLVFVYLVLVLKYSLLMFLFPILLALKDRLYSIF